MPHVDVQHRRSPLQSRLQCLRERLEAAGRDGVTVLLDVAVDRGGDRRHLRRDLGPVEVLQAVTALRQYGGIAGGEATGPARQADLSGQAAELGVQLPPRGRRHRGQPGVEAVGGLRRGEEVRRVAHGWREYEQFAFDRGEPGTGPLAPGTEHRRLVGLQHVHAEQHFPRRSGSRPIVVRARSAHPKWIRKPIAIPPPRKRHASRHPQRHRLDLYATHSVGEPHGQSCASLCRRRPRPASRRQSRRSGRRPPARSRVLR